MAQLQRETNPITGNAQAKRPIGHNADLMPSEKPRISKKRQEKLDMDFLIAAADTFLEFDDDDERNDKKAKELERLIKAGADITAKDITRKGKTALHLLAWLTEPQFCALIIREHAKAGGNVVKLISAKDDNGWTALHEAAGAENSPISEICAVLTVLIQEYAKAGGDARELIAAKDNDNDTALHCAASYVEVCELLIHEYAKAGGDANEFINAKDKERKTALQYARKAGQNDTALEAKRFLKSLELFADMVSTESFNLFMKPFAECINQ
jgi:ankyrin repeat protein